MRPNKAERDKMRKKLEKGSASSSLSSDASHLDKAKYALCKDFVVYLRESGVSQRELSEILDTDEARVSEIVNYKVQLINTDNLFKWHEKICPGSTMIKFG